MITLVVGGQWGDEGKGRVVHKLLQRAQVAISVQGTDNAGHTVKDDTGTYKLHLLPAGAIVHGMMCVVGPFKMLNVEVLQGELALADRSGAHVLIDHSSPISLPIHRVLDLGREVHAGKHAIGTTLRGAGPISADFWLRRNLEAIDLRSRATLRAALERGGYFDELVAIARYLGADSHLDLSPLKLSLDPLSLEETVDYLYQYAENILPRLDDTRKFIRNANDDDLEIVAEHAHGIGLDKQLVGTNSVSTMCGRSAFTASFGEYHIHRVIGVVKAYCTRVGAGPFPTELDDHVGEHLQTKGGEFGSTTGRPRRCGWLDLRHLRGMIEFGGITEMMITKLDVLSGLSTLRVATRYDNIDEGATLTNRTLEQAQPHLETLRGWEEEIHHVRSYADLPPATRAYLRFIQNEVQTPITGASLGAHRDAMIEEHFLIDSYLS